MNSHSRFLLGALFIAGMMAAGASAASITYTLNKDVAGPGTFNVTASTSPGDNAGLVFYSVPLTGNVLTLDNRAPFGVTAAFAQVGFNVLRSADATAATPNPTLLGSQDAVNAPVANLLYGVGQQASSFADRGYTIIGNPDASSDNSWAMPVVLAAGTYEGDISINQSSVDLVGNVFAMEGSKDSPAAEIIVGGGPIDIVPNIVLNALGEREIGAGLINATAMHDGTGTPPISWSNLMPVAGPGLGVPSIAATLDGAGNFSWNPAGSLAGKKGSGNVLYQWTATATNAAGADTDVAFSVILIPEPATMSLVGLAMIGLIGVARRRG